MNVGACPLPTSCKYPQEDEDYFCDSCDFPVHYCVFPKEHSLVDVDFQISAMCFSDLLVERVANHFPRTVSNGRDFPACSAVGPDAPKEGLAVKVFNGDKQAADYREA